MNREFWILAHSVNDVVLPIGQGKGNAVIYFTSRQRIEEYHRQAIPKAAFSHFDLNCRDFVNWLREKLRQGVAQYVIEDPEPGGTQHSTLGILILLMELEGLSRSDG